MVGYFLMRFGRLSRPFSAASAGTLQGRRKLLWGPVALIDHLVAPQAPQAVSEISGCGVGAPNSIVTPHLWRGGTRGVVQISCC